MSPLPSSAPGTPSSRSRHATSVLTPRSKIAALLKSVPGGDSDSSSDESAALKSLKPAFRRSVSPKATETASLLLPRTGISDDSDSEDGAPKLAARPRGKMASRMLGIEKPAEPGDDARKRSDEEEDEDSVPVAPRRKRLTKGATSSPRASASPRSSRSSPHPQAVDSDEDALPANPLKNARFMALVDQKRKEREAREAEEMKMEQKRRERMRQMEEQDDDEDSSDLESTNRMTTRAPRRKASKKAIEEMQRETQRIARNMQLTHEARTRKKITKESLFDKLGFKPASTPSVPAPHPIPNSSSAAASETDAAPQSTPSSSPPPETVKVVEMMLHDDDLPDIGDIFAQMKKNAEAKSAAKEGIAPAEDSGPAPPLDKGKGKAVEGSPPLKKELAPVKLRLSPGQFADDSDSDLEIVDPAKEQEEEARRLLSEKQKLIEALKSKRKPKPAATQQPPKKKGAPARVESKQLYLQLVQKSRLQAIKERDERIEELRARGVIIQTAEEREKEQQIVENLVEKARLEALEIKRREKTAAKREKEEAAVDDEDEDDGEWLEEEVPEEEGLEWDSTEELEGSDQEGGEGNGILAETEESGSEHEDVDMTEATAIPKSPAFSLSSVRTRERDSVSPTPRMSEMPEALSDDDSDDGGFAPLKKIPRKKACISDDEDDEPTKEVETTMPAPKIPNIFKNAAPSSIGMTQLFAGSMDGSMPFGSATSVPADKFDALRKAPEGTVPNSQAPGQEFREGVPNTQIGVVDLDYEQNQIEQDSYPQLDLHYTQGPDADKFAPFSQTQDMPDPTQDGGFEKSSPPPPRFDSPPPATVATVPTQPVEEDEEPIKTKRGRLTRKIQDFSDEEKESDADDEGDASEAENAFAVMKKAAKKKAKAPSKPFDKKNSEAKEMFQEQAEESEDEYAGIGGASDDDDADNDMDEEMKDLLNDEHQEIDENALAAFYAQREKLQDEKDVNKLFKDIQNGMLRKKRGAGAMDLDDSDDEYVAQERRRRAKRRQMAQIRKHLTQNSTIEKIAADPRKAAFFKVLEDNASDGDDDFLDKCEEDLYMDLSDSQSQSQTPDIDNSQKAASESQDSNMENAPPPAIGGNTRRTGPMKTKKPGLAEIRETLSFLVDESTLLATSSPENSDTEQSESQTRRRCTTAIIDRTTITRTSSSSSSSKLAFATDSAAPAGFRVPNLLRRATTNSSLSSDSQATERSLAESQTKKKGTKGGSVNFRAREKARGGDVGEKRKVQERGREARERRKVVGVNLGGGSFS